jgi:hypothetical protein
LGFGGGGARPSSNENNTNTRIADGGGIRVFVAFVLKGKFEDGVAQCWVSGEAEEFGGF